MTEPSPVTVVCGDLDAGPTSASALAQVKRLAALPSGVEVVSLWDGTWADAFAEVAPVRIVNERAATHGPGSVERLDVYGPLPGSGRTRPASRAARALRATGLGRVSDGVQGRALRTRVLAGHGPVWLAGAAAARLVHYVPDHRLVVAHHGEFDAPLGSAVPDAGDRTHLLERVDQWVAGSTTAAVELRTAGARGTITEVADLLHLDVTATTPPSRAAMRLRLQETCGIPEDAPLVCAMGEIDWWDVPDLFVQVAWECSRLVGDGPAPWFLWAAGRSTERMLWPLRHDIRHAGLSHAAITPPGTDPLAALAAADVVAVTLRGEVALHQLRHLEAVGRVLVRFARPGEQPHRADGTVVVPPLDDLAMAAAVASALRDPDLAELATERAARTRLAHDPSVVGPQLDRILALRRA